MRTKSWLIAVVFGAVVAMMATSAVAQNLDVNFNVPFDFSVKNARLHSGHCVMQTLSPTVVRLVDANQHAEAVLMIPEGRLSSDDIKLVFHRYGDQYFLAGVETGLTSYSVPRGSREKELARHGSAAEVAVIAKPATAGN